MRIVAARKEQLEVVTKISKEAFDTDITVGAKETGGPPGYDSVDWHTRMQETRALFVILDNDAIVGGLLVFIDAKRENGMLLGRIFIDPKYHRKGFGIAAIKEMERKWSSIECWELETPIWNRRTKAFYEKNGYVEIHRDNGFICFQKNVNKN